MAPIVARLSRLAASSERGGTPEVTSSPNRRFPPAWERCPVFPRPPPPPPPTSSSKQTADPGASSPLTGVKTAGPHRQLDRDSHEARGARGSPTRGSPVSGSSLRPCFSRSPWLLPAHGFRAAAPCPGAPRWPQTPPAASPGRFSTAGMDGASCGHGDALCLSFPAREGDGGGGSDSNPPTGADGDEGDISISSSSSSVPPLPSPARRIRAGLEEGKMRPEPPKFPGLWGGVVTRPPCPDGHPTARFGPRLTWLLIWD